VEEKRNLEKGFVKQFCIDNGIEFYESAGTTIIDIPRTSRDL
jgi:hypothetical protein